MYHLYAACPAQHTPRPLPGHWFSLHCKCPLVSIALPKHGQMRKTPDTIAVSSAHSSHKLLEPKGSIPNHAEPGQAAPAGAQSFRKPFPVHT